MCIFIQPDITPQKCFAQVIKSYHLEQWGQLNWILGGKDEPGEHTEQNFDSLIIV